MKDIILIYIKVFNSLDLETLKVVI